MTSNLENKLLKLESDPENLDLMCDIGKEYKKKGHFDSALEYFNMPLKIDPDYCPATCCIINLLIDFGRYSEAFKMFNDALEFHYNDEKYKATLFNAIFAQFLLYRFSNKPEEFKTKHNFEELYFRLGNLYKNEGLFEPAIKIFEVAYEISSSNIRLILELSECYTKLNKYVEAEKLLIKLLDTQPDDIDILYKLSELYCELKQFKLTIQNCKEILSLENDNHNALSLLAYSYAKNSNYVSAIDTYNKLLTLPHNKLQTYRNLYILYKIVNNEEETTRIKEYITNNHPTIIEIIDNEIAENIHQLENIIDR
ncbi:MAG: tetratricopeptide repeat protein [Vampirovibrionia bacterium]